MRMMFLLSLLVVAVALLTADLGVTEAALQRGFRDGIKQV
jgi:hypothetical protein